MRVNHDYVALDWVKDEIEQTLSHARTALTAYCENPGDLTRIRFCLTYLHQVHGTLQMVEFFGAALLAEEMEKLAQSIVSQHVTDLLAAQDVLQRAMLQLPLYLDRVKLGRRDMPIVILPLLNELRTVRGEGALTDMAFFSPDMESGNEAFFHRPSVVVNNSEALSIRQLRQLFQTSYAHLIRNQDVDTQLKKMAKVVKMVETLTANTSSAQFWWIADAFIEGLSAQVIILNDTTRPLLGIIDKQLKIAVDSEDDSLRQCVSEEEVKRFLFYIVQSKNDTPLILDVKKAYRLEQAFLSEDQIIQEQKILNEHGAKSTLSPLNALREEISSTKVMLDAFLQSADRDISSLETLISNLKHIGEELVLVGRGSERAILLEQIETLTHSYSQMNNKSAESQLLDVAGVLLYVESTLDDSETVAAEQHAKTISPKQFNDAQDALIRECRGGLEKAKDQIVDFIVSQWNHTHLETVPALLSEVAGGLKIIQQTRASRLIEQSAQFINEHLINMKNTPSWKVMDTLADAISSIEYYLERLAEDSHTNDFVLDIAETSLKALCQEQGTVSNTAHLVSSAQSPSDYSENSFDSTSDVVSLDESDLSALSLDINEAEDESSFDEGLAAIFALANTPDAQDAEPSQAELHEMYAQTDTVTQRNAGEIPEFAVNEMEARDDSLNAQTDSEWAADANETEEMDKRIEASVSDAFTDQTASDEQDDLIDNEIIEIFVEEAGEVIQTIRSHLPQWKLDLHNTEPLTVIRRAFHTLKGSGRLVGAVEVGELAWSIESMLNRVIDGAIHVSTALIDLVEKVADAVPGFISAFEQRSAVPAGAADFMAQAHAISEGRVTEAEEREALLDESFESEYDNDFVSAQVIPLLETSDALDSDNDEVYESPVEEEQISNAYLDPALIEIFSAEASTHLATIQYFLEQNPLTSAPVKVSGDVLRALHTLKGSAYMAGVSAIAQLISPVEQLIKQVASIDYLLQADLLELLVHFTEVLNEQLQQLRAGSLTDIVSDDHSLLVLISRLEEKYHQQKTEHVSKINDKNFIDIFLAEEMDVILEAASLLDSWEQSPYDHSFVSNLDNEVQSIARRACAANIRGIESLCAALSRCYQAVQAHTLHTDKQFFVVTHEAHEKLIEFVDRLAAHQPIEAAHDIEAQLNELLNRVSVLPELLADETSEHAIAENSVSVVANEPSFVASQSQNEQGSVQLDDELVTLFLEEAQEIILALEQSLHEWVAEPENTQVIDPLLRSLHTLKGSARMAAIKPIADLAHEIESVYERCSKGELAYSASLEALLHEVNDALSHMVDTIRRSASCYEVAELIARVRAFQTIKPDTEHTQAVSNAPHEVASTVLNGNESTEMQSDSNTYALNLDPELVEIFLEEADEILDTVSGNLDNWAADQENITEIESLQRSLHTLKGSARMAGLKAIGNLAHELESLYELSVRGDLHYSENMGMLLHRCHDTLADMVGEVKKGKAPAEAKTLISQVLAFVDSGNIPHTFSTAASMESLPDATEQTVSTAAILPFKSADRADSTQPLETVQVEEEFVVDISDYEVIHLFIDEARELLEGIEGSIEQWQVEPDILAPRHELKRLLHTLKGSSRLAGLSPLGDLSHSFESYIINLDTAPETDTEKLFTTLKAKYDGLVSWVDKLKARVKTQEERTNTERSKELIAQANEIARRASMAKEKPITEAEEQQESSRAVAQEMVRVPADMLENLVNLAGETSISRARIEKEVADFKHTLTEINDTIERLQEQMRRLNIETEAQILFSHETTHQDKGEEYEDFDPLEMDRYSLIHQLSRSLAESSNDLTDLKDTLANKTRDTERLLLQQARINTELQEGLMRTRLVPFSRLAPRLRRTVRQVSQELGKNVDLQIVNAEGEMDRSVLERMISPLEHMLRNAIDHGIESPQERERLGKNKTGKITLHLTREGADVVLRLSDDGAGINAKKVRAKAIELKMLDSKLSISDSEALQFIFQPGFSTAEKVTQISGRGVGMDVVNNEIKLLGGSTRIHSSPGVGTQFTIRLPFTVSVNRALMVRVGEDTYAIPLSHIEGIVRISPYELENYYQPGNQDLFKYAERDYTLQYLGAYVKNISTPILQGQTQALPVILIRGTERAMAFQVDSLIGSREVVVKSLGPQLSSVTGLSGATILGDGNVVIILDLISMIRSDWAERLYGHARIEKTTEKTTNAIPIVMVVDDSITVRKITSRLLERNGYEVILAKDGMDAISLLQDHTPDVMLLDIEMPRMDGFEVASIVKHEERLKDVSIIMITSRTGQKHRERAFSIGVNEYLGKPFQETELLNLIEKCISVRVSA